MSAAAAALLLLAGTAAGAGCVRLFNAVPARWLCDYGETPGPELSGRRVFYRKGGVFLCAVFCAVFSLFYLQYAQKAEFALLAAASFPIVFAAVSDAKYGIIPDQCLWAAALPAAAHIVLDFAEGSFSFYGTAASPFLGALCGGGIWLLLGLLGSLLARRESVGFGDVKLFAVMGLLCGFPQILFVFFIAVLTAGVHFSILILRKKLEFDRYMPMGPYLCAACLAALAFRSQIGAAVRQFFL